MVSTHSQYITDFTPKTMEPGKSPLALLAKTCETIGLPDTPSKSGKDKKMDDKKSLTEPSTSKSHKTSPRSTPSSKEPTMTFPGLPKPQTPMAGGMPMPPLGFPFFNPMMAPYPMAFPMGFPMGRMPCPFAMMRQPCMTPGCIQCAPSTSSATPTSSAAQMTPEMMAQFATHPLFSSMMPSVSSAPSYQSLLAASAAMSSSAVPTTSASSKPTTPVSTPKSHKCNWMEASGVCGKTFNDEEELANHVKTVHTPSPPSSSSSAESNNLKTPTSRPTSSASARFNPYAKPASTMGPTATSNSTTTTPMAGMMPQMAMSIPMLPFPLQAMYTQRLMSSTMPQP